MRTVARNGKMIVIRYVFNVDRVYLGWFVNRVLKSIWKASCNVNWHLSKIHTWMNFAVYHGHILEGRVLGMITKIGVIITSIWIWQRHNENSGREVWNVVRVSQI